MICPRCRQRMRAVRAFERRSPPIWLWACRCGERWDTTIQCHRIFRREETMEERNDRILRSLRVELDKLVVV
jgi:hypothetical protein